MSCTSVVDHSRIRIEENKRKAIFLNPDRDSYDVSQIDGCLVKNGQRADFIVSNTEVSALVELKGKDVKHACDQLFASVKHAAVAPLLKKRIGFLVVCSRYPRFDSFVAKAKQQAARQYKAGFHIVTDKGEFFIDRVAAINGPK